MMSGLQCGRGKENVTKPIPRQLRDDERLRRAFTLRNSTPEFSVHFGSERGE